MRGQNVKNEKQQVPGNDKTVQKWSVWKEVNENFSRGSLIEEVSVKKASAYTGRWIDTYTHMRKYTGRQIDRHTDRQAGKDREKITYEV